MGKRHLDQNTGVSKKDASIWKNYLGQREEVDCIRETILMETIIVFPLLAALTFSKRFCIFSERKKISDIKIFTLFSSYQIVSYF